MWKWFHDWRSGTARRLFWPYFRIVEPQVVEVRIGYDKSGIRTWDEPVAWNADAALVEVTLEFPLHVAWPRSDFHLLIDGEDAGLAVELAPQSREGIYTLLFRLPAPQRQACVELHWRSRLLYQGTMAHLSAEAFLEDLHLEAATIFVNLSGQNLPCRAVVDGQSKGLMACAILKSATHLPPILGMDFVVEVMDQTSGQRQRIPVPLAGCQVSARRALVSVLPPWQPYANGQLRLTWLVAGRPLAASELRVLTKQAFERSLYLTDFQYYYRPRSDGLDAWGYTRWLRGGKGPEPCFRVASHEAGIAGVCSLEVRIQFRDPTTPQETLEREILVTDVPSSFVPTTMTVDKLQQIDTFELRCEGQFLGMVSCSPTPVATFTSEGGFSPPPDYDWNTVPEAELDEHLNRLMEISID